MPAQPQRDPVPPFAREVLALYTERLAGVRFPDLDLASLEACADELRDAQRELERIEAAVEQARSVVAGRVDTLMLRAHRALAYARVYAEGDDTLSARIHELSHPAAAPSAETPKKRGRPRKADAEANLFGGLAVEQAPEPAEGTVIRDADEERAA